MEPKVPIQIQRQNLLKPREPWDSRQTFYKGVVLDCLSLLAALALGYFYRGYLESAQPFSLVIVLLALFFILALFDVLLTKGWLHRFIVIVLQPLALLTPFFGDSLVSLTLLGSILFSAFLWGEYSVRHELANTLRVRIFRSGRLYFNKLMIGIVFVGILLSIPRLSSTTPLISQSQYRILFDWSARFFHAIRPDINVSASFEDMIQGIVRLELEQSPQFRTLPPGQQELLVRREEATTIDAFRKNTGISLAPSDPVSEVTYRVLIETLKNWRTNFKEAFTVGWGIFAFLLAQGVGIIFYWAVAFVAFLLYQLLVSFDFLRVISENRTHEIIEFS